MSRIYERDGFRGFYRGLNPAILLYAPASALTFGFYELFNQAWNRLSLTDNGNLMHRCISLVSVFFVILDSMKHAFNGGAAGLLTRLAVYPFDISKKRLEVVNFEEARSKFGQVFDYNLHPSS